MKWVAVFPVCNVPRVVKRLSPVFALSWTNNSVESIFHLDCNVIVIVNSCFLNFVKCHWNYLHINFLSIKRCFQKTNVFVLTDATAFIFPLFGRDFVQKTRWISQLEKKIYSFVLRSFQVAVFCFIHYNFRVKGKIFSKLISRILGL